MLNLRSEPIGTFGKIVIFIISILLAVLIINLFLGLALLLFIGLDWLVRNGSTVNWPIVVGVVGYISIIGYFGISIYRAFIKEL